MPAKHVVIACSFLHISVLLPSLLLFTAFCPLFSPLLFSPLALISQHTRPLVPSMNAMLYSKREYA